MIYISTLTKNNYKNQEVRQFFNSKTKKEGA